MSLHPFLEQHLDRLALVERGIILESWHIAGVHLKGLNMRSGGRALNHAMMVAYLARLLGMSIEAVAAGMLHDVIEDTQSNFTLEELEAAFEGYGPRIGFIVEALTKKPGMHDEAYYDQIFEAAIIDPEVAILKLLDRWDGVSRPYDKPNAPKYIERATAYYHGTLGPFLTLCERCRILIPPQYIDPTDGIPGYDEICSEIQIKTQRRLRRVERLARLAQGIEVALTT